MNLPEESENNKDQTMTAHEALSLGFAISMTEHGRTETCDTLARMLILAVSGFEGGKFSLLDDTGYVNVVYKYEDPQEWPEKKH